MKQFLQLVAISAIIMLASVATNAQNVGIGTASPAQKLEIAGTTNTIRINGLKSSGGYYQAANANSSLLYVNSATGDLYSLPTGSSGTILTISAGGVPTWTVATAVTPAWNLTGNANGTYAFSATPINYFLGTTSATTGFQFGVGGANAGQVISTNFGNTALGYQALNSSNATGTQANTAIGYQALKANTSGTFNTAIGYTAMSSSSTGNYNIGIGYQTLLSNIGSSNTGVGGGALNGSLSGNQNTAVGRYSMGAVSTGSNNTGLGYNSNVTTGTITNATAIGANAVVNQSNALVLGSISGVNTATASTNVGIGTQTPAQALDVEGGNIQFGQALMPAGLAGTSGNILLSAGAATAPTWLANGTSGQVLTANGTGVPTWLSVAASVGSVGTTPPIYNTGTSTAPVIAIQGSSTGADAGGVLYSTGSGTSAVFNSTGSAGYVLESNGTGAPTWASAASLANAWNVTGGNATATYTYSAIPTTYLGTNSSGGTGFQFGVSGNNAGRVEGAGTANTSLGYKSLNSTTGSENLGVGYLSAFSNTTGNYNLAIGNAALYSNVLSPYNVAIGDYALYNFATTATAKKGLNVAIGFGSLYTDVTGSQNVAIGDSTLAFSTAAQNTAVGYQAAQNNTTGSVTALGYEAGEGNTIGTGVTAVGYESLLNNSGEHSNYQTALGYQALENSSGGGANTAAGYQALSGGVADSASVGIGYQAGQGYLGSTGGMFGDVMIGYEAGAYMNGAGTFSATGQGNANTVIGYLAMYGSTALGNQSYGNTALGFEALNGNFSGNGNTAIGDSALATPAGTYSGYGSVAVGYRSLASNTGANNTAVGTSSMVANTSGKQNVAIGDSALSGVSGQANAGGFNVAVGYAALRGQYGGGTVGANTAIGYKTGYYIGAYGLAPGSFLRTTLLGFQAGYSGISASAPEVTNDYYGNVSIGYNSGFGANNLSTALNLGETSTAFGTYASNAAGVYNTFVGYESGFSNAYNSTGTNAANDNTFIGYGSGYNAQAQATGSGVNESDNTFIGYTLPNSAASYYTGGQSTFLGSQVGANTTSGGGNTFLGYGTGGTNTTGADNTLLGTSANVSSNNLTNATAIGYQASAVATNSITLGNTSATSLYLPGYPSAGTLLYTAAANGLVQSTSVGASGQVLTSNGTGVPTWVTPAAASATAWALTGNTVTETLSATSNTYSTNFVGTLNTSSDQPLVFVSEDTYVGSVDAYSGNRNVYLGGPASGPLGFVGNRNQGSNNTGIGESALSSVVSTSGAASDFNVAVGCYSLEHLDGSTQTGASNFDPNTAVGASTLQALTNGVTDEAFGWQAAFNLTSGSRNIALGSSTDYYNQTGNDNVALGDSAMVGSSGNSYGGVVGVGTSALFSNIGSYNTAVGDNALKTNTSGIQNTALGYDANVSANNLTNATAIGYGASAPISNSITLGNAAATSLYLPGYRSAGTLLYTSAANGLVQSTSVGTSGQVLTSNGTGVPTWTTQTVASPAWSLTGNSGTTPGTNFIGTTDPNDLVFKTNDNEDMRIANSTGYVGIGTNNPTQPLSVAQTTPIPGFNQYVISSSAIQTSQLADYQNVAMYGFAAGGNSFHGYSVGVMGVIHPVSHGGAALYGAINTAAPNFTQTNNFYGIYTDASATVAGGQNTYAAAFMNGNVGIGTATPAQSLEVGVSTGTIRVDGMITGNSFNVATAPTSSNIVIANNSTGDLSALASGANGSVLTLNSSGVPTWAANSVSTIAWTLTGNAGTTPGTNFLGTTDGAALMFKAQDSIAGVIDLTNRNAYYGTNAGNYGGGATNSVVIGYNAGKANTAADNQFIGYKAGQSNTTGDENQFEGFKAGNSNTANSGNYFSGYQAGYNSTGDDPTYGYNANMAIGPNALYGNTTGINNLAIGSTTYEGDAGPSTGDFNEVVGINAMNYITTGSENLAVGQNAMYYTEAGNNNTALGVTAEWQTQGNNNTATGGGAMFGFSSNQSVPSTGNDNTANGAEALDSYTSGSQNSAVGSGSMYWSNTGTNNTISGYASMFYGLTANENTAYGSFAMANNSTGKDNTAIGFNALSTANVATIQSDYANYAYSLVAPNTGSFNTTVGDSSMLNNVSGNRNTAIGRLALSTNITGSNNTAIGNGANVSIDGLSNATAIGFNASAPASNSVTLGNSSVNALYVPGYSSAGSLLYTSATNGLVAATSVGSSGQVLTSNGTSAPTWSTPSTTVAVTPVTPAMSPYSVLTTDYLIEGNCSGGAITINLPVAATVKGKVYCIVATNASPSANYITVNTAGESIGTYGTTILLENNYEQEYIVSDGANWVVLGSSKM